MIWPPTTPWTAPWTWPWAPGYRITRDGPPWTSACWIGAAPEKVSPPPLPFYGVLGSGFWGKIKLSTIGCKNHAGNLSSVRWRTHAVQPLKLGAQRGCAPYRPWAFRTSMGVRSFQSHGGLPRYFALNGRAGVHSCSQVEPGLHAGARFRPPSRIRRGLGSLGLTACWEGIRDSLLPLDSAWLIRLILGQAAWDNPPDYRASPAYFRQQAPGLLPVLLQVLGFDGPRVDLSTCQFLPRRPGS